MFTKEESQLLINILSQISISAADPNSIQTAQTIQSILSKLQPKEEKELKKK
jgi:hypothetical protein